MANAAADLEECDDDGDGIFAFNFVETQTEVLGSQDPSNFTLSFHENLTDAEDNANPLVFLPKFYLQRNHFCKIENNVNRACLDTTSFNLTVFDTPPNDNGQKATILTDFDDDFRQSSNSLYNNLPLDTSQANNNTNALASPYYNANPFTFQILHVLRKAKTDCFDTTEFTVNVNPIPEALDANLFNDEDGVNDGLTSFNLAEANITLMEGKQNCKILLFFRCQNSLNVINASPFTNTTNPQIPAPRS